MQYLLVYNRICIVHMVVYDLYTIVSLTCTRLYHIPEGEAISFLNACFSLIIKVQQKSLKKHWDSFSECFICLIYD